VDEHEYERITSKRQAVVMDVCQKGNEEGDLHQVLTFDSEKIYEP